MTSRSVRPMDVIEPRRIEFLRGQDGPSEQELKRRLIPILKRAGDVGAAYLVVADYHDGKAPSVVLCLRADKGVEHAFIREISQAFSEIFSADEHLDVLVTDSVGEIEASAVCSPFFTG